MTSEQIRQHFLDFFISKNHTIVPSAPIVIKNDPSLLFTNAGMNQFKDYFLGNKKAPHKRVADTQKCLRVSGKHNDLEEVGVDTYHHTMFEMLGNWSFGDYFKEEAIAWSWELLTRVYAIAEDQLYVTVFEGDEKESIPKDEESIGFWKKWIHPDRIIMGNKKDNFWEMGDTGPCGPCTEIHVDCRPKDQRDKQDGKLLVNNDHPQVIEIWNNVFIEYNRKKDGCLDPLPAKHVDTGMGFERLVRVLQNKNSNYDTDVFTGTISEIEKLCHKKYSFTDAKSDIAFRVIADHIRAIAFPVSDGQLPSNTGAGYVIRRILRRAVRYYYSYLDVKEPILYKLIPLLASQFEHVFPSLLAQVDFVSKVIHEEENNFLKTLDKGLKRIDEAMQLAQASSTINGLTAFELYDTYGFPLDLTRLIAAENSFKVDESGFTHHMQKQKDRSRLAASVDTGDWVIIDSHSASEFVGYELDQVETRMVKYRKVKSQSKDSYQVVLEKTPFYAESGGQLGDTGTLQFKNELIDVLDTKKDNDLIIHFTNVLPSNLNEMVIASIDSERRKSIRINHSATHLMHAALRKTLGNHVAQKGSLVNAEQLRFDFSHFSKVTEEELQLVEAQVNEKIRENIPVVTKVLPKEEAIAMGAMALFGEKYGDMVRVVIIDPQYSIELCGGTHIANTGELGIFTIKAEMAVGAGIRRIEAVAGKVAETFINKERNQLKSINKLLRNQKDIVKGIEQLIADKESLSKSLEKMEAKALIQTKEELLKAVLSLNGIYYIGKIVTVNSADALRKLAYALKPSLENFVIILAAEINGKAYVSIMIDEALVSSKHLDATTILNEQVAELIKGGGGGQKSFATAGGQDPSKLQIVLDNIRGMLTEQN